MVAEPSGMVPPQRVQQLLDSVDLPGLEAALAQDPGLASRHLPPMPGHCEGADPLNYLAMLRYDAVGGKWRDVRGTGPLALALVRAGAPVDGRPGDSETPLMTAASYGDAEVASVLIGAGADLEALSSADAGGVPEATALRHAAVFGMTEVVDVLVAAGARVPSLPLAAAAGDISGWDLAEATADERLRALIMAADHQRIPVIDALAAAGTSIDDADPQWHRQALRLAAANGRPASVRHLLALGADPDLRDGDGRTALDLCRRERLTHTWAGYDEVEALLAAAVLGSGGQ